MSPSSDSTVVASPPEGDAEREPASTWWCCAECGANHTLIYRRRRPGACASCGLDALRPRPPRPAA